MEDAVVASDCRLAQIAKAARLAAREVYAERSLDRLEEIVSGHVWLGELNADEAIQLWTLVPEFIQAIDLGYAHAGVLRSPKAGPLDGDEIARLTASLNGHLRPAAALHHKLSAARPNGRLLEAAVDQLSFGILVVDWRGKVLAANRTAQDMLQTGDALIERNGVLKARSRDNNERLTHALAVVVGSKRLGASDCVRLSRQSGKPAYIATVAPLTEAVDLASMGGDRAALIMITEPEQKDAPGLHKALQQAFGLTPAEARTAALVGSGLAPQDVADQIGITVGTIRCELKSIFEKLGISRQSELAALVARLVLVHPGNENA